MKTIELIKPDVYDQFQCKGAACRRTCCAGWRITVNKSEYQDLKEKLRHVDQKILGRLPEESRSSQSYGEFILKEGQGCPLQSGEGLCDLQLSHGPEALPGVCAFFPRKGTRYGDQMKLALTPACERVLELLLEKDSSLEFVRQEGPLPLMNADTISGEHGSMIWNHYIRMQEFCILLLQAEDVSLDTRMALLGIGLHQIDSYYKHKDNHKISGYMDRYLTMLSQTEDVSSMIAAENSKSPAILLGTFLSSAAHSDGYMEIIERVQKELQVTIRVTAQSEKPTVSYSKEAYQQRKEAFARFTEKHPHFLENIMVMLFTLKHWGCIPQESCSIWEQYMYACWVYSNLKFVLTACMETISSNQDLLDICVVLFRSWIHNEKTGERAIQQFHDTGTDTLAHMAMLVQAG